MLSGCICCIYVSIPSDSCPLCVFLFSGQVDQTVYLTSKSPRIASDQFTRGYGEGGWKPPYFRLYYLATQSRIMTQLRTTQPHGSTLRDQTLLTSFCLTSHTNGMEWGNRFIPILYKNRDHECWPQKGVSIHTEHCQMETDHCYVLPVIKAEISTT